MVRCITCNVLHIRQFCRFVYCLVWFDTVEFNRLPCLKNEMYDDAVFANRFLYQLTMFEIRVLIWLSRFFHAHLAYVIDTDNIITAFSEYPIVCLIWYARIQSSAMFKQQDIRWCGFRWSIPLSIGYVRNASINMAILTPSCSYCIFSRCCQNHRSILPNFLLLAWFYTIEFNRRLCSNNKMYDDMVWSVRFWYQLTMFEVCIFTGLSRLLDTHIAYEIAI